MELQTIQFLVIHQLQSYFDNEFLCLLILLPMDFYQNPIVYHTQFANICF